MLYPSLQELTNEKVNRYKLVIATAKCARHYTDKICEKREALEAARESGDRFAKEAKTEITMDSVNDKAVSVAIQKLYEGEYSIITD